MSIQYKLITNQNTAYFHLRIYLLDGDAVEYYR